MMRQGSGRRMALAVFGFLLFVRSAAAGPPVAIVEEISAPAAQLQPFDYLAEGTKIALGPADTLTVGYFDSCSIEKIVGATVVIGKRRSAVSGGGRITRRFVQCGGAKIVLSGREAAKAAVVVTRAGRPAAAQPAFEVHSVFPYFRFGGPVAGATLERIDRGGSDKRRLNVDGRSFDLAGGVPLARGGVYRLEAGGRALVFRVSDIARRDARDALGRLVGF